MEHLVSNEFIIKTLGQYTTTSILARLAGGTVGAVFTGEAVTTGIYRGMEFADEYFTKQHYEDRWGKDQTKWPGEVYAKYEAERQVIIAKHDKTGGFGSRVLDAGLSAERNANAHQTGQKGLDIIHKVARTIMNPFGVGSIFGPRPPE